MRDRAVRLKQSTQERADDLWRTLPNQTRDMSLNAASFGQPVEQQEVFYRTVVQAESYRRIVVLLQVVDGQMPSEDATNQGRHFVDQVAAVGHCHPDSMVVLAGCDKAIPCHISQEEREFFV